MRIPLDYYRMLGVPTVATSEAIQRAYEDRLRQQPRSEYSQAAIASRESLLEEAYAVVSDPERRTEYDASFLVGHFQPEDSSSPGVELPPMTGGQSQQGMSSVQLAWLEVAPQKLPGALLILQEVGEYELIVQLVEPLLDAPEKAFPEAPGVLGAIASDLILSCALAYRELGRESWQQGQYEKAAIAQSNSCDLLARENRFSQLRQEIQTELDKLRPYRILELVAQPERKTVSIRKAMQHLREMLDERGGIDGTGEDRSGLGVDEFLRFIQQLRGYLTAAEQQNLFEAEARRPSAAASYLAAYARLARGFAYRQPQAIQGAKRLLDRLGKRQDVHLERAICALLLGQTQQATAALELSREVEPVALIERYSQNAPDLLPGLCLYAEQWLRAEVFPKFRDLAKRRVSLQAYFDDPQVQRELDNLTPMGLRDTEAVPLAPRRHRSIEAEPMWEEERLVAGGGIAITGRYHFPEQGATERSTPTALLERPPESPWRDRVSSSPGKGDSKGLEILEEPTLLRKDPPKPRKRRKKRSRSQGWSFPRNAKSVIPLAILGVLGMGAIGFTAVKAWQDTRNDSPEVPGLVGEQLIIELNRPLFEIPAVEAAPAQPEETGLTVEMARSLVESWLGAKASALGRQHRIEALETVLAEPMLSLWRNRAIAFQREDSYRNFEHTIIPGSVKVMSSDEERGSIEATVREIAEHYRNGSKVAASSYDSQVRVRYEVVRQEGEWRISNSTVID